MWGPAPSRCRLAAAGLAALLIPLIAALLHAPMARAHPFGAEFYSHQIILDLEPEALTVTLITEIPTSVVMKEFFELLGEAEADAAADARYTEAKLNELREGLLVVVDGQAVILEDVTPEGMENGVGNSKFFTYTLKQRHPWTLSAGESYAVEVSNANRSGGSAYYRNDVRFSEGISVTDSTHWEALTDPAVQATDGWTRDQRQKNLTTMFKRAGVLVESVPLAPEGSESAQGEIDWLATLRRLGPALSVATFLLLAVRAFVTMVRRGD